MPSEDLVVLDFETTGLSADSGDRLTEVAAVRIRDGSVVKLYESLINCAVRVPHRITALTGITQAMVNAAPSVTTVFEELLQFVGNRPVVAHNASFDEGFFLNECRLANIKREFEPFICSIQLARRIFPNRSSYALQALVRDFSIASYGSAHRAGADAAAAAELLLRMVREIRTHSSSVRVDAPLLRKIASLPVGAARRELDSLRA